MNTALIKALVITIAIVTLLSFTAYMFLYFPTHATNMFYIMIGIIIIGSILRIFVALYDYFKQ